MRSLLPGVMLVFWAAVACERGSDTGENVRKALEQANMRAVQVNVDHESNIVYLQGTVSTMADRTRANEIAASVVGTSGYVQNELTVEGLTDRRPDDADGRLTDALDERLDADPVLRERDVTIQVTDGSVTIMGEVRTVAEKNRAERIVTDVPGVRRIVNHLLIRPER